MIVAEAPVEVFDEIDSTILEARRRAERGAYAPVWLIARRQTAGRGRRGRTWSSLEGNLLATYFGTTDRAPAEIAQLGFATGLAIADVMDAIIGPGRATLKWPNDVLIDGAKASGLMLDSGAVGNGTTWFALGFGVNLAAAPDVPDQPTACVRDVLPPDALAPEPLGFLATLRPRLDMWTRRLSDEGFEPLRAAWVTRAHRMGQTAVVATGDARLEGRVIGLSLRGELELDTADGVKRIAVGDILLPSTEAA